MAKTRSLEVVISGDARQLTRTFKTVDSEAAKVETRSQRLGRALGTLGTVAGGAAAAGLVLSAKAAQEAEKSQARLEAQLKALGISYQAHAKQIDAVIQKTSQLAGLDDEDLQDAFTNIVRSTGSVDKGLRNIGLAADIARAKHIDVAKAGQLVGRVATGNVTALARYGIQIDKNASASEALAVLQQRFAGQAEAYGKTTAGALDRSRVATENLGEAAGKNLAPAIARVANTLANLINWLGQGSKAARATVIAVGALAGALAIATLINRVAAAVRALRGAMLLLNASFLANPIVLVTAAIAALGVGLVVAYKKSETFRNIVNGAFGAVREGAHALATVVNALATGAFNLIKGAADKVASAVRAIANAFNAVKSAAGAVGGALKGAAGALNPFGDGIGSTASSIRSGIGPSSIPGGGLTGSTGLMGAQQALAPFAAVGARFGLHVSSGRRPGSITSSGNISYHSSGEAIDMADGRGPDQPKMQFFQYMKSHFGSRLAELIYTPGGAGIKNGRPFTYTGQVAADHFDHVHVAFDTGRAGVGDGVGQAAQAARAAGFRGSDLVTAVAIAGAESAYRNSAANLKYPDHSIGMWQINQLAHHGRFGSDSALHNAFTNARAAYALFRGRGGFGDWSTFLNGSYRAYLGRARQAVVGSRSSRSTPHAPAATGGGGGGGASTGGSPPAQTVSDFDLATAQAASNVAQAEATKSRTDDIRALTAQRSIISARLTKIRTALSRRTITRPTKLRLLQEQAQLRGEHASIQSKLGELRAPATADSGVAGASEVASGGTVLGGLVDELHAMARAGEMTDAQAQFLIDYRRQQALRGELGPLSNMERLGILGDIRDEQAANTAALEEANKRAEEERQAREEHTQALKALTDEVKRQTDFATSVSNTSNFQLSKSLADILSGQIVGYGLAGRAMTPGRGTEFAY